MVNASSANNRIKAKAVAKNRVNEVEASNSEAKYWAQQAEQYANTVNDIKDDTDELYSQIKASANKALTDIDAAKEEAIEEILEKGQTGDIPTKVSQLENDANYLSANDTLKITKISQEEYNKLATKDPNTMYVVLTNLLVWGTSLWGTGLWELGNGELSGD